MSLISIFVCVCDTELYYWKFYIHERSYQPPLSLSLYIYIYIYIYWVDFEGFPSYRFIPERQYIVINNEAFISLALISETGCVYQLLALIYSF